MILKGNQRANGTDLATHLMNAYDNERIEIAELHGTVADDLHGAFAEFEAVASGTRAKQPLYSLSINPSAPLTRAQYEEAIADIEKRLGLAGQPRAVVFHIKHGREHCHVVWSRIDAEKMRAIQMSHDHRRLCDISCELARKYGLALPPGLMAWEQKQRFEKEKLEPTLTESAQTAKTGITPEQRRAEITASYERSDTAEAFRAAIAQHGYVLARGDRRGLVIVDRFADVHSLTRNVEGYTARQIKRKLAALNPEDLPDVEQAKALVRQRSAGQGQGQGDSDQGRVEVARRKAREALARKQHERRTANRMREQALLTRQQHEKLMLDAAQKAESQRAAFKLRRAVAELIGMTPGLRSVLGPIQKLTRLDPLERHRLEQQALARRHARERFDIERRERGLYRVEQREKQSLERQLRRTAEQRRDANHDAWQELQQAGRRQAEQEIAKQEENLTVTFNDAAEFEEGRDAADGDDEGRRWKRRTETVSRARRPRRTRKLTR